MSTRHRPSSAVEGLGSRLSTALAELRLSQSALARKLDASTGFVSDVTRGRKAPGAEFLVALQGALGINLEWLLTGRSNMFGPEIDADELMNVVLQLQLAWIATSEQRPEAVVALKAVHPEISIPDPQRVPSPEEIQAFLSNLVKQNEVLGSAISIFNDVLMRVPRERRKAATAKAIEEYVKSKRAPSILSDLIQWNPKPIASGRQIGDVLSHPELGPLDRPLPKPTSRKKTTKRSR